MSPIDGSTIPVFEAFNKVIFFNTSDQYKKRFTSDVNDMNGHLTNSKKDKKMFYYFYDLIIFLIISYVLFKCICIDSNKSIDFEFDNILATSTDDYANVAVVGKKIVTTVVSQRQGVPA